MSNIPKHDPKQERERDRSKYGGIRLPVLGRAISLYDLEGT
jgi:hypothetical protein